MKNLPDEELFDKLKVRLQNFEEEPGDEVWVTIEAALSGPKAASTLWNKQAVIILVLMLLGLGTDHWMRMDHSNSFIAASSLSTDDETLSDISSGPEGPSNDASPSNQQVPGDSAITTAIAKGILPSATIGSESENSTVQITNHPLPNQRNMIVDDSTSIEATTGSYAQSDALNLREEISDAALIVAIIAKPDSLVNKEVVVTSKAMRTGSRWRLYGMVTPSLIFQQVTPSSGDDATFQKLNSPGVLSNERLSFSFEGGAQFPIAKRLAAFAGLTYYQQSMDLSLQQFMPGTSNISSSGPMNFDFHPNTVNTTINYRLQNIGVVTGVSYVVSVGKILHQLGGALQYEYGTVERSASEDKYSSRNFVNFRIFYRAEYGLNERLSMFVQPVFARSLLYDDVMNGAVRVKQSRAGIGIGVLYRLK